MAEGLCQSCGLCCDGTLFSGVSLQASELPWARRVRLTVIDETGARSFPQPCACFDGLNCGEYADRPTACRTFRCRLLIGVESGETSLESALAKVNAARTLAHATFPTDGRRERLPGARKTRSGNWTHASLWLASIGTSK